MYLEETVVVDRPITDVWACIANLFDAPRLWGPTVIGMRQTSPGPLGLGATMRGRMVILGFETRMDVVIMEWDPPHSFALSMVVRPFRPGVARYALETVGDGAWKFSCSIPNRQNPAIGKHYEARAATDLGAIRAVLAEIDRMARPAGS